MALTRRRLLQVGIASAVLAGGRAAFAQQASGAKGPPVWLDRDQAELDAAYDQIKYAPNLPQITRRYGTNSDAARTRLGAPRRLSYGSSPIEALDLYATSKANAPIHIFIHGGADWRRISATRPSSSCMRARITLCPTSSTWWRRTATS